jgi:uncharacterized protein (TIGR03083 family)
MMQISPIYDGPPILAIEGLGSPFAAIERQRLRLLGVLRSLDDAQWNAPSRCEKWSVKDVVSHLVGTDRFWAISFGAGINRAPTRFLDSFDPVASPEQMVDGMRALPPAVVLSQYEAQAANAVGALNGVTDWSVLAEAPPGHLALNVTALHALWDSWVHERDIVIPLGLDPVEDDEEMTLILQYAAALSPAFYASRKTGKRGTLSVIATNPDVTFTVDVADTVTVRAGLADGPRVEGKTVDLIEGLSHRAQLPALPPEDEWLLVGLAEVFDVA